MVNFSLTPTLFQDEFVASHLEIHGNQLYPVSECRLRLALQNLYVVGTMLSDEISSLRQLHFNTDDGFNSIVAGKDFILMTSESGKVISKLTDWDRKQTRETNFGFIVPGLVPRKGICLGSESEREWSPSHRDEFFQSLEWTASAKMSKNLSMRHWTWRTALVVARRKWCRLLCWIGPQRGRWRSGWVFLPKIMGKTYFQHFNEMEEFLIANDQHQWIKEMSYF